MKRIGLAIGAAGVLAVSGAGMATAAGGTGDSVSGAIKRSGLSDGLERHFIVSAHDGPNGATGTYQATYGKGKSRQEYHGRVTCVRVEGNRAIVGIVVTSSTRPDAVVGSGEIIRVIDNGNPNDGAPVDVVSPGNFSATPPTTCPEPTGDVTPTYSGNMLVRDGG
ncbi:MAG TPA: hypothetical protein VF712_07710 [Thermoleophilaceae bacterium]|jgi:hypothetical protein